MILFIGKLENLINDKILIYPMNYIYYFKTIIEIYAIKYLIFFLYLEL
jgi:hypothetical protein